MAETLEFAPDDATFAFLRVLYKPMLKCVNNDCASEIKLTVKVGKIKIADASQVLARHSRLQIQHSQLHVITGMENGLIYVDPDIISLI